MIAVKDDKAESTDDSKQQNQMTRIGRLVHVSEIIKRWLRLYGLEAGNE